MPTRLNPRGAEAKGVQGRAQWDGLPISHRGTLRWLLCCWRVSPSSPRSPAGTGLRAWGNEVSGGDWLLAGINLQSTRGRGEDAGGTQPLAHAEPAPDTRCSLGSCQGFQHIHAMRLHPGWCRPRPTRRVPPEHPRFAHAATHAPGMPARAAQHRPSHRAQVFRDTIKKVCVNNDFLQAPGETSAPPEKINDPAVGHCRHGSTGNLGLERGRRV